MSAQLNQQSQAANADFHGAAVIDANGREVPITEHMVREACEKLESCWQFPTSREHQGG
jgi:hypothetical protein